MKIPNLILATTILFISNLSVRILGFIYKIFLSHNIGEAGLGVYHIIFNFLMICLALTTTGIPTSLSHFISKKNAIKDKNGRNIIFIATIYISLSISFLLAFLVFVSSKFLSSILLNDKNMTPLILSMVPAIITITFSNTLRGYYYGMKSVSIPAIGQVLEQISRILFVYFCISLINNSSLNCYIALIGISVGELVNIIFMIIFLYISPYFENRYTMNCKEFFNACSHILKNSIPITLNKMVSTLIHSLCSIIIPSRLLLSGMTYDESLGIYGIISGMVIPLVYIPFTLGSALVVNLIPSISQDVTLNNYKRVKLKSLFAIIISLISGGFTSILFYFYSHEICMYIFHNSLAGIYLKSMFLVPLFITLNQTITTILHSLGKEISSSIVTILFLSIQLILVYIFTPFADLNIFAYIYTLTLISFLTFISQFFILIRTLK